MKCQMRVFAAATDCTGRRAAQIGTPRAVLGRTAGASPISARVSFQPRAGASMGRRELRQLEPGELERTLKSRSTWQASTRWRAPPQRERRENRVAVGVTGAPARA